MRYFKRYHVCVVCVYIYIWVSHFGKIYVFQKWILVVGVMTSVRNRNWIDVYRVNFVRGYQCIEDDAVLES